MKLFLPSDPPIPIRLVVYAQNGLPTYVYRIADLKAELQRELNAVPAERRYQRMCAPSFCRRMRAAYKSSSIALYEGMVRFLMRLCSHLPHATAPTPITSGVTIIDLEDVSLSLLWSLRSHLQEASTLATANYPETLSTIAVVNAPSFFPTAWGWIKVRPCPAPPISTRLTSCLATAVVRRGYAQ